MTIERAPGEVYAFVLDPKNLPAWASGLDGAAKVRFVERNSHGVLDHFVAAGGREVYVPMRVFPNGEGAEVLITLFRRPEQDDAEFALDTLTVRKDLETLKKLIEK